MFTMNSHYITTRSECIDKMQQVSKCENEYARNPMQNTLMTMMKALAAVCLLKAVCNHVQTCY